MKINAYTLDAFTLNGSGGNPAGVVVDANHLSEEDMRKIAEIINFSETAFVQNSSKADFKVRFFTPKEEVDLCGHATIATFYILHHLKMIKTGKYTQETKAGILSVEVLSNGRIMMNQTLPVFDHIADRNLIADSLGIDSKLLLDYPLEVVSTGIRDLMVGVSSLDILLKIKPDMEKVSKLSEIYDTIGYHLYSNEGYVHDFHVRSIAPRIGIIEEAATGTANGALACYLYKHKIITKEQAKNISFEQGNILGRPSEILAELDLKDDDIKGVYVGGSASNIKEITIDLNTWGICNDKQ